MLNSEVIRANRIQQLVVELRVGQLKNRCSIPGRGKRVLFPLLHPNRLSDSLILHKMVIRAHSPGISGWRREANDILLSSDEVKKMYVCNRPWKSIGL